uniref:Fatty acid desaturase domain-containing protein n=1 Tax=Globodera rostochiensis TaxID=31243 RepID=A0A914H6T5_GLORO
MEKPMEKSEEFGKIRMMINGKWLHLDDQFIKSHPGGAVLLQYKDADATQIFHAFHEGSGRAYKQLKLLEANAASFEVNANSRTTTTTAEDSEKFDANYVMAEYNMSLEKEKQIVLEFEQLRQKIYSEGLMRPRPLFYVRKVVELFTLLAFAFWLQFMQFYVISAAILALCWQQSGWLCHEFCHHQPSKNRRFNDFGAVILGNAFQGFSRDWWKDKHNTHHAATNIIDRDGDIDLAPLLALVPADLGKYKAPIEQFMLKLILPYQHWYFTVTYFLLRISWTGQSILHAMFASDSAFKKHRQLAMAERLSLLFHWSWVMLQIWLLPNNTIRIIYFLISQLGGGFLIAHVVSYNHNSAPKFPANSRLLNNFAALHLLTTRNMRPSMFIDWFWGGLNYQIEHHLFPTMPRPNLNCCSRFVRQFCANTGLPYMVDDYTTGYLASLSLLRQVAEQAAVFQSKLHALEERDAKRA